MKPPTSTTQPGRQSAAKFMKAAIFVCWGFMAGGVIALVVANHLSPAALAAITGAIACLAGVFVVLYQGMGKLARDTEYSLSAKGIGLVLSLAATSILLIFWSISL
jgi:hypothetical protein